MKKKILIGVSSVFVIILCICICFYVSKSNDNEIYQAKVKEKVENQVGGFLTLMLETEAGSGEYQESTSGTWPGDGYVFNSELSSCENGGELSWNSETNTINLLSNKSDACYVYFDVYESPTLANYIINNVYVEDGVNGLYYHDGQGTYTNADQEAGDNSYRYSGANPNNYICFGSNVTPCPEENLHRIIGVFDGKVKVIKSTYATSEMLGTDGAYESSYTYNWNNANVTWSETDLNTINLNMNYLNNIGDNWASFIANHTWKVGGGTRENLMEINAQTAYNYEIGTNSSETSYTSKIGLMYVSDYYYGASQIYWTYPGYSSSGASYDYRAATDYNWLKNGVSEWTISLVTNYSDSAFAVYFNGMVNFLVSASFAVRPVFYLNSNVAYSSGSGIESDPIRLVV